MTLLNGPVHDWRVGWGCQVRFPDGSWQAGHVEAITGRRVVVRIHTTGELVWVVASHVNEIMHDRLAVTFQRGRPGAARRPRGPRRPQFGTKLSRIRAAARTDRCGP